MPFTVLTEADINALLDDLSATELDSLLTTLSTTLQTYSTSTAQKALQPHRSVLTHPNGHTALFMPATTPSLLGTKIVSIAPSSPTNPPSPSPSPNNPSPNPTITPTLQSTLTLCTPTGRARGILNAAALTAFRTALGSMLLYRARRRTSQVLVFGAGAQARWHIRLAVLLRGQEIERVTIANRSVGRAEALREALCAMEGWPRRVEVRVCGLDGDGGLEAEVRGADVVFCTTPSTRVLWPVEWMTGVDAPAAKYVAAIGSYRLDMRELDPALLREVVRGRGGVFGGLGKVVVDCREGCLVEAGEVVEAGLTGEEMVEVGELVGRLDAGDGEEGLREWLEEGLVVYKSVGVGVMDLAIGEGLLDLAAEKGVGWTMESF